MMNNQMVKQELLQYVARLVETSPLQNTNTKEAARHDVAALLVEQALNLSVTENNTKDLFVLKPVLRATSLIIRERINLIIDQADDNYALMQLKKEYLQTISTLEKILENLNR